MPAILRGRAIKENVNMDELISKRAVIEAIEKARANVGHNLERSIGKSIIEILDDVGRDVNRLPSEQPKRGKWIDRGEHGDWEWQADGRGKHWHEWECNICHHYFDKRTFFCPHCGADMRGEQYGL